MIVRVSDKYVPAAVYRNALRIVEIAIRGGQCLDGYIASSGQDLLNGAIALICNEDIPVAIECHACGL